MAPTADFVVQTAPRRYELRSAPLPDIGSDDALLALEGCGVCGTDLEVFEGVLDYAYPLVPGHEPFGRVMKIGRAAQAKWQISEGDRVAVHSTLTCGRCRTCRRGLRGCTAPEFADTTIYGFRSPDVAPALRGGFSTHLYLAPEAIVVPLPDRLSVAAASLFNVMSNGVDWVLQVGGMRAGMTVAILGPGPGDRIRHRGRGPRGRPRLPSPDCPPTPSVWLSPLRPGPTTPSTSRAPTRSRRCSAGCASPRTWSWTARPCRCRRCTDAVRWPPGRAPSSSPG